MVVEANGTTARPFLLGILGGMGPLAGVDFAAKVVQESRAERDQDNLPFILWSDPSVPDRSSALSGSGPSPVPQLLRGIRSLNANEVSLIAVPCNTAHAWYEELRQAAACPLLHIAESVLQDVCQIVPRGRAVGIFATSGTIGAGIYQRALARSGFAPDACEELRPWIDSAIRSVKSGQLDDARCTLLRAIAMVRRRVTAIVLACSELPIAVPAEDSGPLIDANRSLAKACVEAWRRLRCPEGPPGADAPIPV